MRKSHLQGHLWRWARKWTYVSLPFRPRIYIWDCDKRERIDTDFSLFNPMNLRIGRIGMGSMDLNNAQESGSCESIVMLVIPSKHHPFQSSATFFLRHKNRSRSGRVNATTPYSNACLVVLLAGRSGRWNQSDGLQISFRRARKVFNADSRRFRVDGSVGIRLLESAVWRNHLLVGILILIPI